MTCRCWWKQIDAPRNQHIANVAELEHFESCVKASALIGNCCGNSVLRMVTKKGSGEIMAISFAKGCGAYFPVPKVACTSIKEAIYELEYGHPFTDEFVNGVCVNHIHKLYGTHPFARASRDVDPNAVKVALVRDPIKRMLSAYRNRVVDLKDLASEHVDVEVFSDSNLLPDPDANFFFTHLEEYMNISISIDHHFSSSSIFLGDDLTYFDKVFRFEEFLEFNAFFSSLAGRNVHFPHSKKSQVYVEFDSLSPEARDSLRGHVEAEYRFLKNYYSIC